MDDPYTLFRRDCLKRRGVAIYMSVALASFDPVNWRIFQDGVRTVDVICIVMIWLDGGWSLLWSFCCMAHYADVIGFRVMG